MALAMMIELKGRKSTMKPKPARQAGPSTWYRK